MALIGTLREKLTKWVVGFIMVALAAFIVGSDLLTGGNGSLFGGSNDVGSIAGYSISMDEYNAAVQEREADYTNRMQRQPGEREMATLRQQAWDLLIARYAIQPEFEKLGITVTQTELQDMVQGKNIDEGIKNSFLDSAGNFDRGRLVSYLQSINTPPAVGNEQMLAMQQAQKAQFENYIANLKLGRERIKYENLLLKTNYVTKAEAEKDYHNQNDVAEARYAFVPFFAISDTDVEVKDADLQAYYNKTKERYKTEASRDLQYVSISILPSAADSAAAREEINRAATLLKESTQDSSLVYASADWQGEYTNYTIASLPSELSAQLNTLTPGSVFGPTLANGAYKVMKVSKVGSDTTYNAKASHILIRWDNETPEGKKAAKDKAQKILNDIKGGADFAAQAREFGTDGTAQRGGDLGWFVSGQMVKPFQDAVFGTKTKGLINQLVETQFGYHIIEVTEVKNNTVYTLASISMPIVASEETTNNAYLKAEQFADGLGDVESFKARAKEMNLLVSEAKDLKAADRRVDNLDDARSMVVWLFREAKKNKVSSIFELGESYVVAIMTGETKEGYKPFEKVKDEIRPTVMNELKGKKIIEKMGAATGSLEEIAKLFGTDGTVNSVNDLKFNSSSLQGVGFDPKAVGVIFSLENGKRSKPVAVEGGVLVAELQNKTIAPAVGDYTMFANQLLQSANNRSSFGIAEAIRQNAKIEDRRFNVN
ncbi:MAG: peptidylprolyl isomerase [Cyclobacteriaceae bacterium]|jgi:peptidyl-prolyl cis-trans isomerase D|nr:peptidylprolyl isomerase [Cyclobacteriaceae bacterium]